MRMGNQQQLLQMPSGLLSSHKNVWSLTVKFSFLKNFLFLWHLHIIQHPYDAIKPEFLKPTFPTNHGLTKPSPPFLGNFIFWDDMTTWSCPPSVPITSTFPTCSSLAFRIKFWMSILLTASLLFWEVKLAAKLVEGSWTAFLAEQDYQKSLCLCFNLYLENIGHVFYLTRRSIASSFNRRSLVLLSCHSYTNAYHSPLSGFFWKDTVSWNSVLLLPHPSFAVQMYTYS